MEVEWPPHSPDLTPCGLFLRGFLKSKVFGTPLNDNNDLTLLYLSSDCCTLVRTSICVVRTSVCSFGQVYV